jgi:LysM repeat protein
MPARATYEHYTVKPGDTLTAIAKRYGTTAAAIAATNGIADPNKIRAGQALSIAVAEVQVRAQRIPTGSVDPVVAVVNAAASWFKPPRLYVTLGVGLAALYYLLDPPRRPRRRN